MFAALADPARLRLLVLLTHGEASVSTLAARQGEKVSTVSARLQLLHAVRLVRRTRQGKSILYALADDHVIALVSSAIDHVCEDHPTHEAFEMSDGCKIHPDHPHQHGAGCGHTAIRHGDHVDYLHDGHLHHMHGDHVDEHVIEVSATNPDGCTAGEPCTGHEAGHVHGPGCGHEAVPHGDHIDYLVDGRLHHPHGDHCDDHGPVEIVRG